ncbi:MAG: alpha/beta fold hydrolase [Alphaproteobacteria bacterium]
MADVRSGFETIAGCKVRVQRAGRGAPLLFLHGARGAEQWAPFMDALARDFDVIVPEHPGFGFSDMPDWLDNMSDLAFYYLDFLQSLKLDGVHVVGTSLGGWLACEIATRSTQRIKTIQLVAPAGIHVKGLAKGDIFLWSPQETARNLFFDQSMADKLLAVQLPEDALDRQMKNRLTMARLSWQPRLYNPDLHKWLHRIDRPVQIVWGDSDKVIPPDYGPAFQKLIPGSRLEIIPHCGHLPQIEKADAFVKLVGGFIKGAAA